jgi:hypothetical protein
METKFGPMAQDGDFVLVIDSNYMKRKGETYMARVYRGKAYTGVRIPRTNKYIHKLYAECVIPESYVPQEVRRKIYEDMAIHNRDTIEYDIERGILYERDR